MSITLAKFICVRIVKKEFVLCRILFSLDNTVNYSFSFFPAYDVIKKYEDIVAKTVVFQGFDISLHLPVYIRKNFIPSFLSERLPLSSKLSPKDIYSILKRTSSNKYCYFGDNFYISDGLLSIDNKAKK